MITTLTGKNSFALGKELSKIVNLAIAELGDFGLEKIDVSEADVDTIFQAVQSLPFLSPRKLVVIYNLQSNTSLLERISELIDRVPEEVDVVLVGPVLDKRKSPYGLLKKLTEIHEFAELKPDLLPSWIIEQAKTKGAEINHVDARDLVERVGTNQLMLKNEIEKMSLYSNQIDEEVIGKLTDRSVQSTIFSLLDAAFSGDRKRALGLYREQRRNRVDPHYIVAMLTWQLQSLAVAVFAQPQTESTLVGAGLSSYSARKSLSLARNIDKSGMRKMVVDLSDLDMKIKTDTNPDAALELYLLNLDTTS